MKLYQLSLTIIFLIFASIVAKADDGHFYKVTAKTNATGRGLVYATSSTVNEPEPWFFLETNVSAKLIDAGNNATQTTKLYLFAKPYEGFVLEKWIDSNGNTVKHGDNYTFRADSTNIQRPQANVFTAYFVDTYVSAFSANNDLCAVSVSPAKNSAGDPVTLTATPKSGVNFMGWRKKGTATILSTAISYNVTATSTKTTYEAVFRYTGIEQQFVRMQSKSERTKYMSLIQDDFNYTKVVTEAGGYSGLTGSSGKEKALNKACEYLKNDISLSDDIFDAGQIFVHDAADKNFYGQGTNVGYMTKGYSCHHGGGGNYHIGVAGIKLKVDAQDINYDSYDRLTMNPTVVYDGTSYKLGNIYIINQDGAIDVTKTTATTDNYAWEKKVLDGESQYFAFNPTIQDSNTGLYYTTLRTSFSYKIKNTDKVKAYEINEIADGSVIMTPFGADEVIPGDLAVVLESTSQEPTDNILLPYNLEYTKSNSVLFSKYGHRLHCYTGAANSGDQYDNCTEGGIGYFKVTYNSSKMGTMYKLSTNEAGEVGFWTKVATNEVVSGNEAYSTVPCGLFKYIDEVEEIDEITDQYTYNIDELLTVAYIDKNGVIYAKDNNGAAEQAPGAGEEDFMALHYSEDTYGDHSNWVAIEATSAPALKSRIKPTGKVIASSPNRRLQATRIDVDDNDGVFVPNTYCLVNFMPKSSHSTDHHNFFFAAPQAYEVAQIIWAQWDDVNKTFIVPPGSGFTGSITADFSLYNGSYTLTEGNQYKFLALIEKSQNTKDASNLYKVYPLEGLTDVTPTGVQNVTTQGEVINVRYYNLAGVASDQPFDGINIVVTTFSDGSKQAVKVLH